MRLALMLMMLSFSLPAASACDGFNFYCDAHEIQRGCHVWYSTECNGSPEHQTCMKYPNCDCAPPSKPDDNCTFNCFCSAKQLKRGCYNYKSTECNGDPGHQTCVEYNNCSCS